MEVGRSLGRNFDYSLETRFKQIVSLYNSQVNLSHRTSQSILLQQYSTPAPIAFLAGIFCGVDKEGRYFEPSAGNGLLTVAAKPENFYVNEIDKTRNRNLQTQGFKEVFQVDATGDFDFSIEEGWNKSFDAIITNPPFGKLKRAISFGVYEIKVLDHLMCLRALDCMKDNGRAALIIGGHTEYDEKGRVQAGNNRIFFNYLYSHYNVVDVIPIDGSRLYSRQGTSFNVRLILIAGRKAKPEGVAPVYDKDRDTKVQDYQDLFKRVTEDMKNNKDKAKKEKKEEAEVPELPKDGKAKPKWSYLERAYKAFWFASSRNEPNKLILVEEQGNFYAFGYVATKISLELGIETLPIIIAWEPNVYIEIPADRLDLYLNRMHRKGFDVYLKRTTKSFQRTVEEEFAAIAKALEKEMENEDGDLGAPYIPASESCIVLDTVVPDSMEYETKKALEFIQGEVGGNIDEFVRQRLGYMSKIELCKALSAEQTDAVAMAIYNIEAREQGMIIGDQTGIGKGRVAAAMIRYAVLQGHKPVFITEKPNLFSDIYRDLIDQNYK